MFKKKNKADFLDVITDAEVTEEAPTTQPRLSTSSSRTWISRLFTGPESPAAAPAPPLDPVVDAESAHQRNMHTAELLAAQLSKADLADTSAVPVQGSVGTDVCAARGADDYPEPVTRPRPTSVVQQLQQQLSSLVDISLFRGDHMSRSTPRAAPLPSPAASVPPLPQHPRSNSRYSPADAPLVEEDEQAARAAHDFFAQYGGSAPTAPTAPATATAPTAPTAPATADAADDTPALSSPFMSAAIARTDSELSIPGPPERDAVPARSLGLGLGLSRHNSYVTDASDDPATPPAAAPGPGCSCATPVLELRHRRAARFLCALRSDSLSLPALRKLAWSGAPPAHRAAVWQILLGYLPLTPSRRSAALARKRSEYFDHLERHYLSAAPSAADPSSPLAPPLPPPYPAPSTSPRPLSPEDSALLHQVRLDLPRTAPGHALFHVPAVQLLLERVLFTWAARHPAAGYVQGMNDLLTPLVLVFLEAALSAAVPSSAVAHSAPHAPALRECVCPTCVATAALPYASLPPSSAPTPTFLALSLSPAFTWGRYLDALAALALQRPLPGPSMLPPSPLPPHPPAHTHVFTDDFPNPSSAPLPLLPSVSLAALPASLASACAATAAAAADAALTNLLTPARLAAVEADAYWCFASLLGRIQDNYVPSQPGIAQLVDALGALLRRLDPELADHLEEQGVLLVQFAFRWFNCLLLREISLTRVPRLWDAAFCSESAESFASFHVYLAATLLLRWRDRLLEEQVQDVVMFLQRLPTDKWTDDDVELLLSQAYVYQHTDKAVGT